MKKRGMVYLLTGIVIGMLLFGAVPVVASALTVVLSSQPVTVDGSPVQVTAYNINGSNYYNLRDMAAILDIGVWYDETASTVRIESDKSKVPGSEPAAGENKDGAGTIPEGAFRITEYYNVNGKLSALGEALPANSDGEKTLTVKKGDIVVVGDKQYKVAADSLTLSFYTQPSSEQVITWWTDYMKDWLDSGDVENA